MGIQRKINEVNEFFEVVVIDSGLDDEQIKELRRYNTIINKMLHTYARVYPEIACKY